MLGSAETNKDGLLTNFLPALFCTTAITYTMYIIILNTRGFVLHIHYHLLIHIRTIAMSRSHYVCTGCIYMRTHTCNHIRIYVHTYVYTYLHKQVNVRIYAHKHLRMHADTYIYTYIILCILYTINMCA